MFFMACILFCLTLPFLNRYHNWSVGLMGWAWLWDGSLKSRLERFRTDRTWVWIFLFYLTCVVSVLYSEDKIMATDKIEAKLAMVLLPFMIFSSSLTSERISKLLAIYVWMIFVVSLLCIEWAFRQFLITGETYQFFYHNLTAPLKLHAIYFANFLAFAILIVLFNHEFAHFKKWRFALIGFFLLIIVMLSGLAVMGYLVCLGVTLGGFLLRRKYSVAKTAVIVLSSITLLVAITFATPYTRHKIAKSMDLSYNMDDRDTLWNTVTIRLAKWTCAAKVIKENPVAGVGIGDAQAELMKSYEYYDFKEGLRNEYNEHNQYLATLVATGAIGFIFFMGMLLAPVWKAVQTRDYLLFAFMALMTFTFFTENFLTPLKGVMFFAFFYAILLKKRCQ